MSQSLAPPFTTETAHKKVKIAQDLWNTKDAARVAQAYTPDSTWRNRDQFFQGTAAIEAFLTKKWETEHNYRLRKELFTFQDNKIAVEFWYENTLTPDESGQWYRTYGIEHWTFHANGKMSSRQMSGNTVAIAEEDRWMKDVSAINDFAIPRGHISG